MSVAEMIQEVIRTRKDPPNAQQVLASLGLGPLKGKVQGANIKLDATDLPALGARIRSVRKMMSVLKKEDERLRTLILASPQAKIGYADESIEITKTEELDVEHPPLLAALRELNIYELALNTQVSAPRVRGLVEDHPEIKKHFVFLKGRKVCLSKGK